VPGAGGKMSQTHFCICVSFVYLCEAPRLPAASQREQGDVGCRGILAWGLPMLWETQLRLQPLSLP